MRLVVRRSSAARLAPRRRRLLVGRARRRRPAVGGRHGLARGRGRSLGVGRVELGGSPRSRERRRLRRRRRRGRGRLLLGARADDALLRLLLLLLLLGSRAPRSPSSTKFASQPGEDVELDTRGRWSPGRCARRKWPKLVEAVDRPGRVVDEVHQVLEAVRPGEGVEQLREVLEAGPTASPRVRRSTRTGSDGDQLRARRPRRRRRASSKAGIAGPGEGRELLGRLAEVRRRDADVLEQRRALVGELLQLASSSGGPRGASRGTSRAGLEVVAALGGRLRRRSRRCGRSR